MSAKMCGADTEIGKQATTHQDLKGRGRFRPPKRKATGLTEYAPLCNVCTRQKPGRGPDSGAHRPLFLGGHRVERVATMSDVDDWRLFRKEGRDAVRGEEESWGGYL